MGKTAFFPIGVRKCFLQHFCYKIVIQNCFWIILGKPGIEFAVADGRMPFHLHAAYVRGLCHTSLGSRGWGIAHVLQLCSS